LLGGGNVGGGGGGGGTTPTPPELLPPHAETVSAAAVTDATNQLERNKEQIPIRGKKTSENSTPMAGPTRNNDVAWTRNVPRLFAHRAVSRFNLPQSFAVRR
jgi:hypothetical protein